MKDANSGIEFMWILNVLFQILSFWIETYVVVWINMAFHRWIKTWDNWNEAISGREFLQIHLCGHCECSKSCIVADCCKGFLTNDMPLLLCFHEQTRCRHESVECSSWCPSFTLGLSSLHCKESVSGHAP